MMYICAWHAAPLQPSACTVSRIADAAESGRPAPPYSSGISAAEIAGLGQRAHEFGGIAALAIELAPVLAGEAGAQLAHFLADLGVRVGARQRLVHDAPPDGDKDVDDAMALD